MTKPGLLLCMKGTDTLLDAELSNRFEIVRLWEADDPHAALDACGTGIIAAMTWQLSASQMDRLLNLRLIVVPGAGYEGIDVAAARKRGVTIANAGNTHSGDVADHAVALILAAIHQLPKAMAWVQDGDWSRHGQPGWHRHAMSAQRFGIAGLGNIGEAIAERLTPFGGEIAWWSSHRKTAKWPRRDSLLDLARWCSVLIVATRGDAAGLVDAETIAAVGADGLIVNISRGAVIDEDALIAALKSGRLGQAALDVFAQEPTAPERWQDVPNAILTPHIAGVAHEALIRLRKAAAQNLKTVLDGGPLINEITG